MTCDHIFIRINDATKPRPNSASWNGQIAGAKAGCLYCGQIRAVFEDGEVRIVVAGGVVVDETHDSSRP